MKIVHCFFTFEMGGAQVLAVDLLNKMCGAHETSLIVVNNVCSEALIEKLDKRVKVYRINRKEGSRNPWPLLKFNMLLYRLQPDIVHCHEYNIATIMLAKVGKRVYTIHDVGLATTHYAQYDSLVAISDAVQQDVATRLNRPIAKVYNGMDTSAFKQRTNYNLTGQKIKLVQLSRLMHEKKGQDILIEALHQVKQNYGHTNFSLDIIGAGASQQFLEELIVKLELQAQVTLCGEQNRTWLYENLQQYHLLVQPSRYEGFGLTILEGFAAGLPVLASDIEGPAEIIARTPRGFLFKSGSSTACAEKLHELFTMYENGTIAELMQNTRPITEQEYAIDACVEGYLQEYKKLVPGA